MDLFVYYTSKSAGLHDFKICMSGFSAGNLIAFNTIKSGIINGKTNWDRVEVWDFNGDGLAEVMNLKRMAMSIIIIMALVLWYKTVPVRFLIKII